jgi:hypothetical protein
VGRIRAIFENEIARASNDERKTNVIIKEEKMEKRKEASDLKVDFHIHTLCSDGVYTVDEVFEKIMENGISRCSITDHDTIEGTKRARELSKNRAEFLSGLEITCAEMTVAGLPNPISIHLLGYGFDEDDPCLNKLLERRNALSRQVYEELAGELTGRGYPCRISDVPISCGIVLQLCDVLQYMREKYGTLERDIELLIDSYNEKLTHANITAEEGIKAIHEAGGKAVWAHPFSVYHRFKKGRLSEKEVLASLTYLKSYGLDGLEAYYLDFSQEEREWLRERTEENGLIYTAGSDFHGSVGRDHMGVTIEEKYGDFIMKNLK